MIALFEITCPMCGGKDTPEAIMKHCVEAHGASLKALKYRKQDLPLTGFNLDPQSKPILFCIDCGTELDINDVDANLATWGIFKCLCSDCIGRVVPDYIVPRALRMD
jgi:hypothetical protein